MSLGTTDLCLTMTPNQSKIITTLGYPCLFCCAENRLHHDARNLVRVAIRGRSSVLEVTVALRRAVTGNTDRGTTVRDTVAERIDSTGLVSTGKTQVVALTVDSNVLLVSAFKLLDSRLNVLFVC